MGPEQSYSRLRFPGPPASISPTGRPLEELSRLWCSERWAPKSGDRDTLHRVAGHSSGWNSPPTGRVGPPASPQTGREHRTCSGNTEGLSGKRTPDQLERLWRSPGKSQAWFLSRHLMLLLAKDGKCTMKSIRDCCRISSRVRVRKEFELTHRWLIQEAPWNDTPVITAVTQEEEQVSASAPRAGWEGGCSGELGQSSARGTLHRVRGLWWTCLLSPRITVRRWEGKGAECLFSDPRGPLPPSHGRLAGPLCSPSPICLLGTQGLRSWVSLSPQETFQAYLLYTPLLPLSLGEAVQSISAASHHIGSNLWVPSYTQNPDILGVEFQVDGKDIFEKRPF